jgi:hypothetical protein
MGGNEGKLPALLTCGDANFNFSGITFRAAANNRREPKIGLCGAARGSPSAVAPG